MSNKTQKPDEYQDPLMYASLINSFVSERNPIQTLVGDFTHMVKVIINLGKTRQLAHMQLTHLQNQVAKVERDMASTHPQTLGTRLNKIR